MEILLHYLEDHPGDESISPVMLLSAIKKIQTDLETEKQDTQKALKNAKKGWFATFRHKKFIAEATKWNKKIEEKQKFFAEMEIKLRNQVKTFLLNKIREGNFNIMEAELSYVRGVLQDPKYYDQFKQQCAQEIINACSDPDIGVGFQNTLMNLPLPELEKTFDYLLSVNTNNADDLLKSIANQLQKTPDGLSRLQSILMKHASTYGTSSLLENIIDKTQKHFLAKDLGSLTSAIEVYLKDRGLKDEDMNVISNTDFDIHAENFIEELNEYYMEENQLGLSNDDVFGDGVKSTPPPTSPLTTLQTHLKNKDDKLKLYALIGVYKAIQQAQADPSSVNFTKVNECLSSAKDHFDKSPTYYRAVSRFRTSNYKKVLTDCLENPLWKKLEDKPQSILSSWLQARLINAEALYLRNRM